jgi:hypothetical protein
MKDPTLVKEKHIVLLNSAHSVFNSISNYYELNQTTSNLNESNIKFSFYILKLAIYFSNENYKSNSNIN